MIFSVFVSVDMLPVGVGIPVACGIIFLWVVLVLTSICLWNRQLHWLFYMFILFVKIFVKAVDVVAKIL